MKYLLLVLSFNLLGMNAESKVNSFPSKVIAHSFRMKPGMDFVGELTAWAKEKKIRAASIVTVVGSFKKVNLRYANQPKGSEQEGFFEIVSLVGTFNESSSHLHASVSNSKGETFGGHLLLGNIIYTTAEVVVAELPEVSFMREKDVEGSGWDELVVKK
jgi:predicted DNA-binding protein with PD1-like motif